jgi:hypothetical protein
MGNVAVGRNMDGRLQLFVRGTDNALWNIWQTAPNGPWSGWNSLHAGFFGVPGIARNQDGRLEVFVCGPDNALWHRRQVKPGGGWE